MRGGDDVLVEERLRALAERLHGPRRLKADLLTEARHGLLDAVEAYREGGLSTAEAHRRAVAEFGTPGELARAYQTELAAGALRGLSLRVLAVAVTLTVAGDLTWRGSSWSEGPRPPAGYQLLSSSINWIWLAAAVLAAVGMLLAGRRATPGGQVLDTVVGAGLTGVLAVGVVTGAALLGWSFGMWDAALTWPPLLIGTVLIGAGHLWLGRAATCWIRAVRPVRADGARLAV
ncbi:permease prefix domain 1-containing protein [Micromonospora sp. NPDC049799]|uniref:permease prefix domain 1-containing protein n=1 Tax=Micromonospora sp. NPDC049799 TaxID=3154741 RepID=UPI00340B9C5F